MDFITLRDGKITEVWVNGDMLGMMQQIGAIPSASPQQPSSDSDNEKY
jgi:hypothetical protein